MDVLKSRLSRTLGLTNGLADGLSAEDLALHNGTAASNSIGTQFWCLVGARESYGRAFEAGAWKGFSCSLKDVKAPEAVRGALASSQADLLSKVDGAGEIDATQQAILLDLIEHEAQHHGQLIRYFYANGLAFPEAFAKRYSLG